MTKEGTDNSGPKNGREVADYDFVQKHFEANGLGYGAGDLVMFGAAIGVLGEILAHSLSYVEAEGGRRAVQRVVLLQPPGSDDSDEVIRTIGDAIARGRGENISSEEAEILAGSVHPVQIKNFATESLLPALEKAAPRSVVVIRRASSYRATDLWVDGASDGLVLPEDLWVPHLHALCARAIELVKGREVYCVIEADQEWPIRKAHQDLLNSVVGLGVLSGSVGGSASQVLAARLDGWAAMLGAGSIGAIQREIDALPSVFDAMKPLMHLQILRKAGLNGMARRAIAAMPPEYANVRPTDAVVAAEIALELGANEAARRVLSGIDLDQLPPELLDTLLRVSDALGLPETTVEAERYLETRYPASPALARYRIGRATANFDYRAAAEAASKQTGREAADEAALYGRLADRLGTEAPDHAGAVAAIGGVSPRLRCHAMELICRNALQQGHPVTALELLASLSAEELDERLGRLALRAIRESIVAHNPAREERADDVLRRALSNVLAVVARTPANGHLRNELALTLSVETMGLRGLAFLVSIALEYAKQPPKSEPLPDYASWPKAASDDAVFDFLAPVMRWMAKMGPGIIGRIVLPEEFVPKNADSIAMGLLSVLERHSIDPERIDMFKIILVCAVALAPHARVKDMDISMIRMAAVRMALANRHQEARDYAETALLLAGGVPRRARMAWLCHGDVYARNNNLQEALIAACCGYMADGTTTPDQIWSESMLLFRIARDLKMTDNALAFLDAGRKALSDFGALGRYGVQIDTSALQVRMFHLQEDDDPDVTNLAQLLQDVFENARAVLSGGHQVGPVAAMLGQIVREARLSGLEVAPEIMDVLTELTTRSDASLRPLLEAALKARPSTADVATLLGTVQSAQHAEDLAFDLRHTVVIAHRLLASEEALMFPAVAAFAVEVLSDLATVPPGASGPILPLEVDRPLARATALAASTSLPVVFVGLDSEGALLRMVVGPEGAGTPVREDRSVFDRARFRNWTEEFPFRYGVDETTFNLFHVSTEGLGLSGLPERAVIVAGAPLQRIPPNVFRIGDKLAGEDHRLFVVPSMAWLDAVRAMPPRSGRSAAWISTEATPTGSLTLQIMAERLRDTFQEHRFELDEGPSVPEGLAAAELAVVAAHGGLLPGGFYFHVIANDAELRAAARRFADAIRDTEVVVLFVCSGGRVDGHPMSNTTVGLVKYAMEAGCKCVVASPWPLDARVPSYWLPAFLDAWTRGLTVVDATFEANEAVKARFSPEPRDYLAMTVYGDGLRTRAPRAES